MSCPSPTRGNLQLHGRHGANPLKGHLAMAYLNRIGPDLEGLITSLTKLSPKDNANEVKKLKDFAIKELRNSQHLRADHFDIRARLDGLDEKFRVLGKDDLADALAQRRKELAQFNDKIHPEILLLLLELSDRPAEKSDVADLKKFERAPSPPPLTLKQILDEDPDDDEDLWKDIDYAAASSGDEGFVSDEASIPQPASRQTPRQTPATQEEPLPQLTLKDFLTTPDPALVDKIKAAQWWRKPSHQVVTITELQVIRQCLVMLLGVSTELFHTSMETAKVTIKRPVRIEYVQKSTLDGMLNRFITISNDLLRIRRWLQRNQLIPMLQSFQDSVGKVILKFDRLLNEIQHRLIQANQTVVSIIKVFHEVDHAALPLRKFADLLEEIVAPTVYCTDREPFTYLSKLYNAMDLAQLIGETAYFELLAKVFFDTLQTYLRPIRQWMEQGELDTESDFDSENLIFDPRVFFVSLRDKSSELSSIWQDRFRLRLDEATGEPLAPLFVRKHVQTIFNTGKSVAFLREMGENIEKLIPQTPLDVSVEPALTYAAVCGPDRPDAELDHLIPFTERLDTAFHDWLASKSNQAHSMLQQKLFAPSRYLGGGLLRYLTALQTIYLGRDGSLFGSFAKMLFNKLDSRNPHLRATWSDRYVLTARAQDVFASHSSIDGFRIRAYPTSPKGDRESGTPKTPNINVLSVVCIDYHVPWALSNIVARSALSIYHQIFTLLLQHTRAESSVQRLRLRALPANIPSTHLAFHLRHRLLWFLSTLIAHLHTTVFTPAIGQLDKGLRNAKSVDEMIEAHEDFVRGVEKNSLLSENLKPISGAVKELFELSVAFGRAWEREAVQLSNSGSEAMEAGKVGKEERTRRRRRVADIGVANSLSSSSNDEDDDVDESDPESSDDDNEDDGSGREKAPKSKSKPKAEDDVPPEPQKPFADTVSRLSRDFETNLAFVVNGLRGVSRAGGETTWEMLAERLGYAEE